MRRLAMGYRFLLNVSGQNPVDSLQAWRGAFAQSYRQLFHDWPTPNESRKFEKRMLRRIGKTDETDRAFVEAFNDYLDQKPLSIEELEEVIQRGREASKK